MMDSQMDTPVFDTLSPSILTGNKIRMDSRMDTLVFDTPGPSILQGIKSEWISQHVTLLTCPSYHKSVGE